MGAPDREHGPPPGGDAPDRRAPCGLADLLAELKSIDREQDLHRARLRDATKRHRETMVRGTDLRNRLVAAAQSHLGVTNPMLVELGIKPRERRRKKKEEEPPAEGEAAAKTDS